MNIESLQIHKNWIYDGKIGRKVLGTYDITNDQLRERLERLDQADDFIQVYPVGYFTPIYKGGLKLTRDSELLKSSTQIYFSGELGKKNPNLDECIAIDAYLVKEVIEYVGDLSYEFYVSLLNKTLIMKTTGISEISDVEAEASAFFTDIFVYKGFSRFVPKELMDILEKKAA